ncbi:MAG: HAMP domain-containing histidine kinase [Deltaproteobacteria bacterium]|nr:HAMP domain-containing histidine kinase [Deltaproteobacteria bacterium]
MSAGRLSTRVSRLSLGALALGLAGSGAGTAALLHQRAVVELDRLLLVAAQAGEQRPTWANGHHPAPVTVWSWDPGEPVPTPLVGAAEAEAALHSEAPLYLDRGADRLLLLAVEPPDVHADPTIPGPAADPDHPHALRLARAPREGPARTVGVFLMVYAAVSLCVVAMAALLLPRRVEAALAPLDQTRRALEALRGLAVRSRLPPGGPDEVAAVVRSVNDLLERLDAAVSVRSRFTAAAAHELRTPVALLQAELELALRRPRAPEAYQEALRGALGSVGRLRGLVEGLMALARVDAGHVEEGKAPEHLSAVIGAALAAEGPALAAAGCAWGLQIDEDPELPLHGPLMCAAIGNLLRNCATHAPGRPVHLRLGVEDGVVRLVVEDQGPGLRPRADAGAPTGLGLGLRLCREVSRRHGGALLLEPAPGGGLRATLVLPVDAGVGLPPALAARADAEGPG